MMEVFQNEDFDKKSLNICVHQNFIQYERIDKKHENH